MDLKYGVLIDTARRYYSLDALKRIVDEIKLGGGHYLQLHFSDNQGYRIASDYLKLNNINPNDHYLTKTEVKELITYANNFNIMVVPDFDSPAHSESWMKQHGLVYPDVTLCTDFDDSVVNYFDDEEALEAVKKMINEITEIFHQPMFLNQRMVIGADEVPGSNTFQTEYVNYVNKIADYVTGKGYQPAIWNDGILTNGLAKLNSNIEILYWQQSKNGLGADVFLNAGRKVYNGNFYSLVFMPADRFTADDIVEQCDYINWAYKPDTFCHQNAPYTMVYSDNIVGTMMTFWGENAMDMSEEKLLSQVLPVIKQYFKNNNR